MKFLKKDGNARYLADFLAFSAILAAAVIFVLGSVAVFQSFAPQAASQTSQTPHPILVIDPGHGGEDGGASGSDGTLEKDLNLRLSACITEILSAAGYDVRMTRTDDRMLYDLYKDLSDYKGHKKSYDLRNRLRFTEDANAGLFVSIHMNKFPQKQYNGLQVYYSPSHDSSKIIAGVIQNYAKTYLQPDNSREIKKASSSIYLLNRIQIPAVLIECGFLSNDEDLSNLKKSEYQKQLALTIACAIAESVSGIQG